MTPAQVLAAVAGLLMGAGICLVVATLGGWSPRPRPRPTIGLSRSRSRSRGGRLVAVGAVGLAVWAVTGWPALGIGAVAALVGLPAMVSASSRAEAQIGRVEAVEEWARRLSDVLAIGVGLEQAIQTSARTAPAAIEDEVSALGARLAARMPTEEALRRFADEVDDPTADLVVAALILASRRRGPGVASALTAIADSVAEEVAARRRIEADRARPRTTARAVTLITIGLVGMGLLNRAYAQPYETGLGQAVLASTLGFFVAALWWMHSMTSSRAQARVLGPSGAGR